MKLSKKSFVHHCPKTIFAVGELGGCSFWMNHLNTVRMKTLLSYMCCVRRDPCISLYLPLCPAAVGCSLQKTFKVEIKKQPKSLYVKASPLKISPVGDWRSTSLEWPWPWLWFRPYGISSCITHRPYLHTEFHWGRKKNFFWRSQLRFWSSSESRDTKTRTNIKNQAWSNLDIVL